MSFAPRIPVRENNFGQQQQQQQSPKPFINYDSPNLNNSVDRSNMNGNLNQRLELIEQNLNRVCNQHDALMPLLNILEAMPQITKNENEIKNIKINQKNLEQKLRTLETQVNQNSNQHVFGTIERNFKQQNSSISQIKNQIKEIEQNMVHHQKVIDSKTKEESQHVYRNVDNKLDKNKKDIQNILAEFKNTIQIEQKKQEELSSMLKNPSYIQNNQQHFQQNNQMQASNNNNNNEIGEEIHNDIQNLYREIGMMRSEVELLYDKERRNHIFRQLDQEPPLSDTNEKELVVANLEQSVFFEELERYDRENQERLAYELNCLEDKLNIIQQAAQTPEEETQQGFQEELKQEVTYIEDRFFNIKQQIKGTKKKYLVDVRKLEDRLDNLYKMREQIQENQIDKKSLNQSMQQQMEHLNKHMIIIDSYSSRVDRINQNIVENVEQLQTRQKQIDEKLLSIHKTIQK